MSTAPLLAAFAAGLAMSTSPAPMADRGQAHAPVPVRLVLDRTRYAPGAHGQVHVRTGQSGYLVVLYADPSGHIDIALPIDPGVSGAVPADTDIEVRGRGGRDPFVIDDSSGVGTWYAAISARPYQFDSVAVNGHWDYRVVPRVTSNAEADLTAFVERIATDRFDYDIVSFAIDTAAALSSAAGIPAGSGTGAPSTGSPPDDPSGPGSWIWPGWWPGGGPPWWLPNWPGPYYGRAMPAGPGVTGERIGGVTAPAGAPSAGAPSAGPPSGGAPSETRDKPSPRREGEGSGDHGRHGSG